MVFELERHDPHHPALVDGAQGTALNYEQLLTAIDTNREILAALPRPALAMLNCRNTVGSILAYLGCLAADVPVCLVEPNAKVFVGLVERYRPSVVIVPPDMSDVAPPVRGYTHPQTLADGQYRLLVHPDRTPYSPGLHPSLALMLTTSGSTGSSKLVRLSRRNLAANAKSIAEYLRLGPGERSVQSLPMHYAYGLSLINSHLLAGGTVVLNPHSFMQLEFWSVFDQNQCTSFAGVPHMYELLHRLNFNPAARPTLRTMTQAGGGLATKLVSAYHQTADRNKKQFFVMYGQTEATARISYVPPHRLGDKIGSVGIPIPGGTLRLEPAEDIPHAEQLVYQGPNVMLGYATGPEDLSLGNVQRGCLRTGDLGRMDDDGCFFLSGRLTRFAKVFGRRVNLDDIEEAVEGCFPCRVAAVECGNRIGLLLEPHDALDPKLVRLYAARFLSERPHVVQVELVDRIPLTPSGKKDYPALISA
jgi:long-chain acyl-CoA synthetase